MIVYIRPLGSKMWYSNTFVVRLCVRFSAPLANNLNILIGCQHCGKSQRIVPTDLTKLQLFTGCGCQRLYQRVEALLHPWFETRLSL